MTKKSIFSKINQSIDSPFNSISTEVSDPTIDSLTRNRPSTASIQEIELTLDLLIASLQRGELPVNFKKITQVFDGLVTSEHLQIDIPVHKFVDLYNDLPNILIGYAIGATLSNESYLEPDVSQITFHRLDRGTYWVFPTKQIDRPGAAWLVPNPLKDIKISKNKSLNFSFDINSSNQNHSDIIILEKPAQVQILPNSDRLTWKLVDRGEIRTGGSSAANNPSISSISLTKQIEQINLTKQIEQIIQTQLQKSDQALLEKCQELIDQSFASHQHKESNTVSNDQSLNMLDAEIISTEAITTESTEQNFTIRDQADLLKATEHLDRGRQKEEQKDIYGALDNYNQAIKVDPNFARAYFNRGLLKKNSSFLKDKTGAISDFRIAAALYRKQGNLDIYESILSVLQELNIKQ
jgi:tetratricopeptide (TPR) repeat protein